MSIYIFPYKQVTTRAAHDCVWCPDTIPGGSKAYAGQTLENGDFWSCWMHPECFNAWESSRIYDETFYPGTFERGVAVDDFAPSGPGG